MSGLELDFLSEPVLLRDIFSCELFFSRSLIVWRLSYFNVIGRSQLVLRSDYDRHMEASVRPRSRLTPVTTITPEETQLVETR